MAIPVLSSSTPAEGATDVYINIPLDITFTDDILESSVSSTSVLLEDVGANDLVPISVELIESNKIRISPIGSLPEDTLWKISFPGTDIAISASYVIQGLAGTSEALEDTITITFRTGSRTYIDDTSIDKDAADLSLEGDLNLPIHVKALGDLALDYVVPKNNSYDVAVDTTIVFTFNQVLSTGDFTQNWLNVDIYPMLDSTAYLASGDTLGSGSIPDYGVTHSDKTLTVTFSGYLPQNAGIEITLDDSITDVDGSEYGPNNYKYSITTDRYPSVSGIHVIHRELKAISDELTNDYIAATLLSSTIRYLNSFRNPDIDSHLALRWITARSVVDILDDKELEKAVVAGTRRQLGDMSVSVDPIIGLLALKHKRALDELDNISKTICKVTAVNYSLEAQVGISRTPRLWFGVNQKLIEARFVYWQPDIPASNIALNRGAKVPPSYYF